MRVAITIALSIFILVGVAYLALHIDASIAKDEYVKVEAPQITLESEYDEGVYTLSGTIMAPTPCTPVSATSALDANGNIRVDVTVGVDSEMCLMVPHAREFSTEIGVAEEATVSVFVNQAKAIVVETL